MSPSAKLWSRNCELLDVTAEFVVGRTSSDCASASTWASLKWLLHFSVLSFKLRSILQKSSGFGLSGNWAHARAARKFSKYIGQMTSIAGVPKLSISPSGPLTSPRARLIWPLWFRTLWRILSEDLRWPTSWLILGPPPTSPRFPSLDTRVTYISFIGYRRISEWQALALPDPNTYFWTFGNPSSPPSLRSTADLRWPSDCEDGYVSNPSEERLAVKDHCCGCCPCCPCCPFSLIRRAHYWHQVPSHYHHHLLHYLNRGEKVRDDIRYLNAHKVAYRKSWYVLESSKVKSTTEKVVRPCSMTSCVFRCWR